MDNISVHVVGYEEHRQIGALHDSTGKVVELKPVEGSERAFLDLQLPNKEVVRAEISHNDFMQHITTILSQAKSSSLDGCLGREVA
ncbi:hypothetical protein WMF01_30880 [Sorangium sp. So ce1667]